MDIMKLGFDQWLEIGIRQGFCTPPICETHEGLPLSVSEEIDWESGDDPCIHIMRLYADKEQGNSVELNNQWIQRWRKEAGY